MGRTGDQIVWRGEAETLRSLLEELAFVTSVGHRFGGDSLRELGYGGAGPTIVISDLGILRLDPQSKEFTMTDLHPGPRFRKRRR